MAGRTPAAPDWAALEEYQRAVGIARHSPNPFAKDRGDANLQERISRFRIRASNLHSRLDPENLADAAFGGLQDSAPRAGQVGLHARMSGVHPGSWDDPRLVQTWLRWADYLVPRRDVDVFTLGALPRRRDARVALEALADRVVQVLDGIPKSVREVAPSIPGLPRPHLLRSTPITGRVNIRWDARTTVLLPAEPGGMDDEQARCELARRFLGWIGPASVAQFATWAGVSREDAELTWAALGDELMTVPMAGSQATILARDHDLLSDPGDPIPGVRFLPMGDPYLYRGAGMVEPATPPALADKLRRDGVTSRVINGLTGRVLLDGRVGAAWGRSGAKVTIAAWRPLNPNARDLITAECSSLGTALGRDLQVTWLV